MLVVITIIGMLVGLVSVAVFAGMEAAKKARSKAEVTQLEAAIQAYKTERGDFPPSVMGAYRTDPWTATTWVPPYNPQHPVYRHLAKAFPRCDPAYEARFIPRADGTYDPVNPTAAAVAGAYIDTAHPPMNPAQALVFWLTSTSNDAQRPLSSNNVNDRKSYFDFDASRIQSSSATQGAGWYLQNISGTDYARYMPGTYRPRDGSQAPYVYYDARTYLDHSENLTPPSGNVALGARYTNTHGGAGVCLPYLWDAADRNKNGQLDDQAAYTEWDTSNDNLMQRGEFQTLCANPKSFQIITAGMDNDYGNAGAAVGYSGTNPGIGNVKVYPLGAGYSAYDDDNLSNFSEKPLGDAKP